MYYQEHYSNLFETQEERIELCSDDNMSTVRVKMVEREDLEANLLIKAPDNKQTRSHSTGDSILAVEKPDFTKMGQGNSCRDSI